MHFNCNKEIIYNPSSYLVKFASVTYFNPPAFIFWWGYIYFQLPTLSFQVLPFDDNLCVTEPCGRFDECITILKFGNASDFISSNTVFFRPIYPVTTNACRCPKVLTTVWFWWFNYELKRIPVILFKVKLCFGKIFYWF